MKKKKDNIKFIKGNYKKTFFYLFFTILFASSVVLWAIYNSGNYRIGSVILRPSVQRCGKNFDEEIQTTQIFVEKFVNSYREFIKREINPKFKDLFALAKGKNLSAIVFFSAVSEALLCIYPSNQNELIVECSQYPVQMSVLSGIEEENSEAHLTMPYEEALKKYNNEEGLIRVSIHTCMISNLTLSSDYPKIFSFSENSLITLSNVRIEIKGSDEEARSVDIETVGFLTGEKNFSFAIGRAEELGRYVAEGNILHLFITSEFFRTALLDEHLSMIAKEINQNLSRVEKDDTFTYSFWEFKEDVLKLKEEAERYGIDASYIDDLLIFPANQPKDGFLFRYCPNYFWFSVQWSIINISLLVLFVVLITLKLKWENSKIAVLINKLWAKLTILLSINVWVFYKKPEYMGIKYWIVPGVFFIACFLLTVLKPEGRKSKALSE